MELTHDEIKAILERQREICGKGYLLYCKDHNLNASTICQRMIKGASEPYVNEEYYNYNNSNRLDGVVIQKPADGIKQTIINKINDLLKEQRRKCADEGIAEARKYMVEDSKTNITPYENEVLRDNVLYCDEPSMKDLIEEIDALIIAENGEGYAEGIGQTLEATKRTEKMLLDECCKALGWQGGTIHQIINVLSAARRVKLVHDEVELSNDWDKFKAAIVTLKAVV